MARIMIDTTTGPTHGVSRDFDNIMVKVTVQGFHVWKTRRPLFFSLQQFGESRIQPFQSKNEISMTTTVDTCLWPTRQPLRHFVLSKIPSFCAPVSAALNVALCSVYDALTVAPNFVLALDYNSEPVS